MSENDGAAIAPRAIDVRQGSDPDGYPGSTEDPLGALVDASPDALALLSEGGCFRFVSPAIEDMTGIPRSALLGTSVLDLVHPDERSAIERLLGSLAATPGGREIATCRFRHSDGTWRVAEGVGRNLLEDPRFHAIVINVRDVTERVEEERALREREERHRAATERDAAVLNALPAHVALLDERGGIRAVNLPWRRFAAENGLDLAGDGVGLDYLAICDHATGEDASDARAVAAGIRRVLAGEAQEFEHLYPCHAPHERRWYRVSVAPFGSDERRGAVVVHSEATQQVLAEEALRGAADRYRRLVELSPEPIAVHSGGKVVFANRAACELVGARAESEVIGRSVVDLVDPDSLAGVEARLAALASGETETVVAEETLRRIDGSPVEVESVAIATLFEGKPAIQVLLRDVSARKRAEDELRRARDDALAASRLKSTFLANMSHEIRTPLNVILGYGQLLESTEDAHARELAGGIRRASLRLLATIHGILDISRVESGTFEVHPRPVDLVEAVQGPVEEVAILAREKGLDLRFEPALPSALVRFDPYCLTQIVFNLVSNAIKFTPRGSVVVRIRDLADGALELSVQDTGIGMSPDYLPRLFDAFSQEESGYTRGFEGSGLGLALTRRFVEMNGASISVETVKDEGSVFTVRVPGALRAELPVSSRSRPASS